MNKIYLLIFISILFVSVSFLNARQTTDLSSSYDDLIVQNKVDSRQIAKENDISRFSKNESKTNFDKKFKIILKSNHTLDDFDQSSCVCVNFICKCCSNVQAKQPKGFTHLI